jgi:hypothetical protein
VAGSSGCGGCVPVAPPLLLLLLLPLPAAAGGC